MPFSGEPYIDFKEGDLAYGLHGPRGEFLKWCLKKDKFMVRGELKFPNMLTLDTYQARNADTPEKLAGLKEFLGDIKQHDKYARYYDTLKAGTKHGDEAALKLGPEEENSILRAKSKFGIEWTIRKNRGHIHFVLDGMNMAEVATKTYLELDLPKGKADSDLKIRSITGSELRWIYRNRNVKAVQDRVQFWFSGGKSNFSPVSPPWEVDSITCPAPRKSVGDKPSRHVSWKTAWSWYKPSSESAGWE
ncbi:hypothetical protein [Hahella sp. NBU794]|uniref:hypothetical protein n=1 Tax=Hahella sp. NBU794 TaxID=3422590 RepID=UPI003D6F9192